MPKWFGKVKQLFKGHKSSAPQSDVNEGEGSSVLTFRRSPSTFTSNENWFRKGKRLSKGYISSASQSEDDNEDEGSSLRPPTFSLEELRCATEDFSSSKRVAQSDWGAIYKGMLANGCTVAIRKMDDRDGFLNEMYVLSKLQHQNIIRLSGYCIEEEHLLLVYESMEYRSLDLLLSNEDQRRKLNWQTRLKICMGIAKALNYLHDASGKRIIHRSIKPWNVLLDDDFNPKLFDFSVSISVAQEKDGSPMTEAIIGTVGYIAPEYLSGGHLSSKVDVYSFGILVVVIASGKQIKDFDFHVERKVRNLKRNGNLLDILDPTLGGKYSTEEAQRLLDLSIMCTESDPDKRPDMSLVIRILEGKEKLMYPFLEKQHVDGDDSPVTIRRTSAPCGLVYPFRMEEEEVEIEVNVDPLSGNLEKFIDDLTNMPIVPSEVDDNHNVMPRMCRSFDELMALVLSTDFREALFLDTQLTLMDLCQGLLSRSLLLKELMVLDQMMSFLKGVSELSSALKVQDDQSLYLAKYDSVKQKVESTKNEARKFQSRASQLSASIASINERTELINSEMNRLEVELVDLSTQKIDDEKELREIGMAVASSIKEVPSLARWLIMEFNHRKEADEELHQAIKHLAKGEADWISIQNSFK